MKMIASTKLNKAQRAMAAAKAYGDANNGKCSLLHPHAAPSDTLAQHAHPPRFCSLRRDLQELRGRRSRGCRQLFIVVSSDKGLCGGIHSSVTKRTKAEFNKIGAAAGDANSSEGPAIIVLGEKSKAQLGRALPKNISLSFNQIGKDVPTFADATAIADQIIKSGIKFDKVNLIYNKYVSALSFESDVIEVFSENALRNATQFKLYEQEDDVTKDLAEFAFANAVYAALVEGHASEINSKRNAMDNASKNAGDMISNLNMIYNRGRQPPSPTTSSTSSPCLRSLSVPNPNNTDDDPSRLDLSSSIPMHPLCFYERFPAEM